MQYRNKEVTSVYSGRDGKCCCGCAGKHYYASKFAKDGEKLRGYKIKADEISDAMVTKVVNIFNRYEELGLVIEENAEDCYSTVVGNRLYVIYLREERVTS